MANRLLTINIRQYLANQPRRKRPARISRYIRARIAQQTNIRLENIRISQELNSIIQKQYLYSMVPLKVNINIEKDKATVTSFDSKPKKAEPTKAEQAKAKPAATVQKKPEAKQEPKKAADAKELKK